MTQRIKVQLGPWLMGASSRAAVYSAVQQQLRRFTLLRADNAQITSTGAIKSRFSTEEVEGFRTSIYTDGNNIFFFDSPHDDDPFLISFKGSTIYAYNFGTGAWETIGTHGGTISETGVSAKQVGQKLFFAGVGTPGYVERYDPLFGSPRWRISASGASGADDNIPPELFLEISGLWALANNVDPNTMTGIPDTGSAASVEISTPGDVLLPDGTVDTLSSVTDDNTLVLSSAPSRRTFYAQKLAVKYDTVDSLYIPNFIAPRFVESFKGRLVYANNRDASTLGLFSPLGQSLRLMFSRAGEARVFLPAAPVLDGSPIDVYLDGTYGREIIWIAGHQQFLFVGLTGGISVFYPDVLTPSTATQLAHFPADVSNAVAVSPFALYFADNSRGVWGVSFDDLSKSFRPTKLNYWSDDLFDSDISRLVYIPQGTREVEGLVAILADGTARIGVHPKEEQDLPATLSWYKVDISGVDIINVLATPIGPMFIVKDAANNYILLTPRQDSDIAVDFYDSATASASGTVATSLPSGTDVFYVAYIGSDAVESGVAAVSGGSFQINTPGAFCKFGVPFEVTAVLPPLNALGASGHFEGDRYRKLRAQAYFVGTRAAEVDGWPIPQQTPSTPLAVVPSETGYKEVEFRGWERDAEISISNVLGYNFEVASVFVEYEF